MQNMKVQAEELHQESLQLLAKLASKSSEYNVDLRGVDCSPSPAKKAKLHVKPCTMCHLVNCPGDCDKENVSLNRNKTPIKNVDEQVNEPITPTSNLKMLVCAASVLNCEKTKNDAIKNILSDTRTNSNTHTQIFTADITARAVKTEQEKQPKKTQLLGRKEKSLGLLCKRFMLIYPEFSPTGTTVLLDDVVKSLGIGRRRVYDIVNVLESMEMMVRQAKNKYLWYGKSRLPRTLTKLKALAIHVYGETLMNKNKLCLQPILPKMENLANIGKNPMTVLTSTQIAFQLPDPVVPQELSNGNNNDGQSKENKDDATSIMDYIISCDTKKEASRSLGILCQKFIMLFMVSENNVVTLERAAKILIDKNDEGPAKYKTKVRRLYDIANILTSIDFLEKTSSFENATKKAAYKWIGMDLKSLDSEEGIKQAFQTLDVSATRHSLLAQVPRLPDLNSSISNRKLHCRSFSAQQLTSPGAKTNDNPLAKMQRTVSAITPSNRHDEEDDGFDVDPFVESECEATSEVGGDESPNQQLFKEKLRELQKEFPDKLTNNGLKDLISSSSNITKRSTIKSGGFRRSLSGDFDRNTTSTTKNLKLDDVVVHEKESMSNSTHKANNNTKSDESVPVVPLKPLLSYPETNIQPKATTTEIKNEKISPTVLTLPTSNIPKVLTSPKVLHNQKQNQLVQPLLVSTLGNPISLQKGGGLYRIIPLQCKPMNKSDKPIPVFIGQQQKQQQQGTLVSPNTPPTNMVTMVVRPPVMTASPTLLLSPRNSNFKTGNNINIKATTTGNINNNNNVPNIQQATEKYPEFFTPPHTFLSTTCGNGKPAANPIIFPKMTPETPSSDPKSVLTAVTRKLMSLQNNDSV